MATAIFKRGRRPPPDPKTNAFASGTLQLVDQLRRDVPGQPTANRYEQSAHYRGILYIAIRAIMDALLSSTCQINRKHRRYAQVSMRRLEKSLDAATFAAVKKALPTPHANSEDEQFRPFDDPDHSLVKLIDQPNRTETFNELLSQLVLQYNLTGSGLLWANPNALGVPGELYVLPTALCQPQPPTPDYPEGWWRVMQYYPSGGFGLLPSAIAGGGAPVDGRDIFQFKNPHPLWRWDAYSPLTACATQLDVLESIDIARWSAMESGLTPDMVLLAPGVQQTQLDAYLERLKQTNIGKRNHRKVMAIGGDQGDSKFDVKFPSGTAKDMDFASGWDQMTAFALAAFGVPKSVAGLATTGSYAELYAALKQFHTLTLRPLVARLGVWLTRHLARIWGKDLAIQLDLPTIDDQQLQEQQLSTDLAHDGLTYNEYRGVRGRKPVPGGDVIPSVYVQQQQAKAQQAAAPQQPPAPGADPNAAPQPGAPAPVAAPDTSSPNAASPQAAPAGGAPQPDASQQADPLASLLGTPTPGGDDQHVQNSVADAALGALGVAPQQSPIGTQTKAGAAQFEKAKRQLAEGLSFGRPPGARAPQAAGQPSTPARPIATPTEDPTSPKSPKPATSDGETKAGEANPGASAPPPPAQPAPAASKPPKPQTALGPQPPPAYQEVPPAPTKPGGPVRGKQSPPPDASTPQVPVNPAAGRAIATPVAADASHPRETNPHDTKRPGEFAPKGAAQVAPAPDSPVPQGMSHDDAAKVILAGNNYKRMPDGTVIRGGADLKAYLDKGGELGGNDHINLQVAAKSAAQQSLETQAQNAPVVQPVMPKERLTATLNAGQLPHADAFKPAAAAVPADTPAAQAVLQNAPNWAAALAARHADKVAAHLGVTQEQAQKLLTHAISSVALHAAQKSAATGQPVQPVNGTLPVAPGQNLNVKFHPRTSAARQIVNDMAEHIAGGNELTPQQAAEFTGSLDHLPPDEVTRVANSMKTRMTVSEQRMLSRLTKHATEAAPEEQSLGQEGSAAAPQQSAAPNALPPAQKYFRTKGGSLYAVHGGGQTTRVKSDHTNLGHDAADTGLKGTSHKTVYVPSGVAGALSSAGLTGPDESRVIIDKDGKASLITRRKGGQWGRTASGTNVPISNEPKPGLSPLELWHPTNDIEGHEAYSKMHAGTPISSEVDNATGDAEFQKAGAKFAAAQQPSSPNAPAPAHYLPRALAQTAAGVAAGALGAGQDSLAAQPSTAPAADQSQPAMVATAPARPIAGHELQPPGAVATGTNPPGIARPAPQPAPASQAAAPIHNPDVEEVGPHGITKAAKVGVPAEEVPDKIPRLPPDKLTAREKQAESSFAEKYEENPDGVADQFLALAKKTAADKGGGPPEFGTDDAKLLSQDWSSPELDKNLDQRSKNRATLNLALHQTANAIAKRAFLKHLDTLQPGDKVLVTNGGCGCHGIDTPIRMLDGTIKKVQDVEIGDQLMGPDSKARTVLRLIRNRGQMYLVKPTKGEPFTANEDHVLSLETLRAVGSMKRSRHVRVNMTIREVLNRGKTFQKNSWLHRVAVDYPEASVPLDPYFLGLWLGDGTHSLPQITAMEPEIVGYIKSFAAQFPETHLAVFAKSDGNRASDYKIALRGAAPAVKKTGGRDLDGNYIGGPERLHPVLTPLRKLGVYKNKHIPQAYLVNSRAVRLNLLAGLLDTDGHLSNGYFEITAKSDQLAQGILTLARSLGFGATSKPKKVRNPWTGAEGTYNRISITGDVGTIPVLVARKKAKPRRINKSVLRTGYELLPLGEGDYYGFTLTGDSLYLLEDFTVTHNSGKGFGLKQVDKAKALKAESKAVFDSAGDQNASENPWIQRELEKRGLKGVYVYTHVNPFKQWDNPEKGVIKRAHDAGDGRMVDAHVFADSYALGAKNHQKFVDANKDNPNAQFVYIDNNGWPKEISGIPQSDLNINRHELARHALKKLRESNAAEHVKHGGDLGTRIWGAPETPTQVPKTRTTVEQARALLAKSKARTAASAPANRQPPPQRRRFPIPGRVTKADEVDDGEEQATDDPNA